MKTKFDTSNEWDAEEVEYERVATCLECAQEFVAQAKLLALDKRAHHGLLARFETVNSKIQIAFQSLEEATSYQSILRSFFANDGESHDWVVCAPRPISEPITKCELPTLTISPCLICNNSFDYYDIVLISCICTYHAWCIGFHL